MSAPLSPATVTPASERTCTVTGCGMVGPHGHDRCLNPVLIGSRVIAHRLSGVVQELRQFNALVKYDHDNKVRPVGYELLEVLDDDDSPVMQATGKLQDAVMLIQEASRLLPDDPQWGYWRWQLKADAAQLSDRIRSIELKAEHS